jgi:predicted transcriptional regulator
MKLAILRATCYDRYRMKPEPALYDDPNAPELARQRALEDIQAGRVVPHEKVVAWLKTWGTPDEKPMPPEWLE